MWWNGPQINAVRFAVLQNIYMFFSTFPNNEIDGGTHLRDVGYEQMPVARFLVRQWHLARAMQTFVYDCVLCEAIASGEISRRISFHEI